jgi:hypothetical protein
MARWNSPRAAGMASSMLIAIAPADSPITVTHPGSPPNPAMLSRTQVSAAIWSSRNALPASWPAARSPR